MSANRVSSHWNVKYNSHSTGLFSIRCCWPLSHFKTSLTSNHNFFQFTSSTFGVSVLFFLLRCLPYSNSYTSTMLPSLAMFSLIQNSGMLPQLILWSCHLSNHYLSDPNVPFISSSENRAGPLVICTLLPGMVLNAASRGYQKSSNLLHLSYSHSIFPSSKNTTNI